MPQGPHIEPMDIYDGEPWTAMDIHDLTAALRSGSTIEAQGEAAFSRRLKSREETNRDGTLLHPECMLIQHQGNWPIVEQQVLADAADADQRHPAGNPGQLSAPDEETARKVAAEIQTEFQHE